MPDPIIDTNTQNSRYVRFPFGKADAPVITAAPVISLPINNSLTVATISQLGSAATVNAVVNPDTEVGARINIKTSADGTARQLTFGTGFQAVNYTVAANKTATLSFLFDGVSFVSTGAILNN